MPVDPVVQTESPRPRIGEVLVAGEFISQSDLARALTEQSQSNERLGEILVRLGVLSEMELNAVLHFQSSLELTAQEHGAAVRHKLGDLLLRAKKLSVHQLDHALGEQEKTNEKLGQVLVRLGLVSEADLQAVLTWQQEHTHNSAKAVRFMLGEILVASKVITRDHLKKALEDQRLNKRQIGEVLLEAGLVKPNHIADALRIQGKLVAASLLAVIGSAALTGCGTGATLTGIDVSGATTVKTKTGVVNLDNNRGTILPFGGGSVVDQRSVANGGAMHLIRDFADGSRIIDGVPFYKQNILIGGNGDPDNTCGQAASAMVLRYWGGAGAPSYQEVVNESNKFNLATTHKTMSDYLDHKGLAVNAYKNGNFDHLKSAIDQGHPVIVLLQFDVPHYVVVVGYNEDQEKLIYHDSIDGPYQQLDENDFKKAWYNSDIKNIPVVGGANYVGLTIEARG